MSYDLIVFDLDDTLLDTHQLLIPIAKTKAFFERIEKPLPLIPGALENLHYLKNKYPLALLTFGDKNIQKKKISSMNIASFFKEVYLADPQDQMDKEAFFRQIKGQYPHFLSIGNRRSTDIRGAKKVNGRTCLFKYGEHQNELVEQSEDIPDFEISHHQELITVCQL